MVINRRQFLALSSAAMLAGHSSVFSLSKAQRILSCRNDDEGNSFFSIIDQNSETEVNVLLPQRGHGICATADERLVAVFARRPGDFVWVIDLNTQQVVHKINATSQRHFYGHGVFTLDGSTLLCSENAYETGEGVIGVYDAHDNFARIGEFQSDGIGPHEIKLLADGKTLIVANGGIQTHPDSPRVKLNLETMRPNLAYIDITSGRLLHKHELDSEFHQLSIRHIDISSDNTVAIAMQSQGDPYVHPPLIAVQQGEQPIKMLTALGDVQNRLRNYCGSVAFSHDSKMFAVSSPRGGLVTYWSAKGNYLGLHNQTDACGVSDSMDDQSKFLISDGSGAIMQIENEFKSTVYYKSNNWRWDNHMLVL
jgi:hypothetical protein